MKTLLVAASVVFISINFAASAQRSTADELVSMAVNPSTEYSRTGRTRLALLLHTYCQEVLAALPTNKPNEQTWVLAEMRTSDFAKLDRLLSTVEYARYQLKDRFDACAERAGTLFKEQQRSSSSDITRYEAAQLVSLAVNFNDDRDMQIYAQRAGLNSHPFRLDFLQAIRRTLLFASMRALENK